MPVNGHKTANQNLHPPVQQWHPSVSDGSNFPAGFQTAHQPHAEREEYRPHADHAGMVAGEEYGGYRLGWLAEGAALSDQRATSFANWRSNRRLKSRYGTSRTRIGTSQRSGVSTPEKALSSKWPFIVHPFLL